MKTPKKNRSQFSALLIQQEWLINAFLYGQNIVLNYIVHAATKGETSANVPSRVAYQNKGIS